jgi:tetratricopeptide (TPR) repeat protein
MKNKAVLILLIGVVIFALSCQKKEPQAPAGDGNVGTVGMEQEVKFIKDVLQKDPQNVNAWKKLGNVSMDIGRYPDAIEAYTKALELDPNDVNVRIDMGSCYRYAGLPDRAIEEYKKALAIVPDHPQGNKNLAIVLSQDLHKNREAADVLENYLKKNPGDPDAPEMRKAIEEFRKG